LLHKSPIYYTIKYSLLTLTTSPIREQDSQLREGFSYTKTRNTITYERVSFYKVKQCVTRATRHKQASTIYKFDE